MRTPIYILAGQSNANAIRAEFQDALDARIPDGDYHFAIVATGGAPLTWQRSRDDWYNDTELRQTLFTTIKDILDADPNAYLAGVAWVQGEADTYTIARAQTYAEAMNELFDEVRQSLNDEYGDRDVNADDFDVVISGLSDNAPDAPSRENWDNIQQQQETVAAQQDTFHLVDPDDVAIENGVTHQEMFKDGLHYSNSFQQTLSDALVETLILENEVDTGNTLQSTGMVSLHQYSGAYQNIELLAGANISAFGDAQNNGIEGNSGRNILKGQSGNDTITGHAGNDRLFGGDGDDILEGGTGWDRYNGGAGADTFVFRDDDTRWGERVTDYQPTVDSIHIDAEGIDDFGDLRIFEHATIPGVVVNYQSSSFILLNTEITDIVESDFVFI